MPRTVSEMNKDRPRVRCPEPNCEKDFSDKTGLSRHKRKGHNPSPKIFKCPFTSCDRVMAQKGNLNDHIRACHTNKPYKCESPGCEKAFATRGYLSHHRQRGSHTRTPGVVSTGLRPLPQQLVPGAEAGRALEDSSDTVPSPQSQSEAGSPEVSTPSQSQYDDFDLQGMLSPSPASSPRARDLYHPELVTSTLYTTLLPSDHGHNIVYLTSSAPSRLSVPVDVPGLHGERTTLFSIEL
ncbi:hypothetical protein IW261DRAFT_1596879 [Armillaria novae-zelandiae]|uniref:C2H2-type domain-containing protein n=1 Tax=Armillaria novae-zelandiae TaxID=153914 RepID=A0AA39U7F1_9AGAR|nr:hypothetical protein IW261DRAFT_1596879 [Armillaria novae-zelandiae]